MGWSTYVIRIGRSDLTDDVGLVPGLYRSGLRQGEKVLIDEGEGFGDLSCLGEVFDLVDLRASVFLGELA